MREPVAITGVGIVCALGNDRREVAEACRAGRRPFALLRRFDASGFRVALAAEISPPGLETGLTARSRFLSQTDRFALRAAAEALAQAALPPGDRAHTALFVGASSGGMEEMERALGTQPESSPPPLHTLWSYPVWATARALQHHLRLGGPRVTTMTACSSSAHALGIAMQRIRRGDLQVALAGGSEALCRLTLAGFGSLGVLDPGGTRPFSANRQGITLGEGAAFLVLEGRSRALARGAHILGWIVGYGASADAHHMVHPPEDGAGAFLAMSRAVEDAGLVVADVDTVNAHGTGTQQNDAAEAAALGRLFGDHPFYLSSSKSMLGHTLGAGGALEAALTVLGMANTFTPPNPGTPDPIPLGAGTLVTTAAPHSPRRTLSSSFAFGGNNAALVLAAPEHPSAGPDPTETPVGIVGAALSTPLGTASDPEALWNLLRGPGVDETTDGNLRGLDPAAVLGARTVRRMDPLSAAVCAVVHLAGHCAGLSPCPEEGITLGTSFGALEATDRFLRRLFTKGPALVNPLEFPNLVHNAPAGYAAILRGAQGYNVTSCQEELAGDEAVEILWERLREGLIPQGFAVGGDLHFTCLDEGYRRLGRVFEVPPRLHSLVGALAMEPLARSRAQGRRAWAEVLASRASGPGHGLLGAIRAVLREEEAPDLWLTTATTASQRAAEDAAAATGKLGDAGRINVRQRLGSAGGSGVGAIALGAAAIHLGRARRALVTSMTLDGAAHATLLGVP